MKTKFYFLSALALCSLAFVSCSDDDSNNPNPQLDTRVRTYVEDSRNIPFGSLDTMDVTYDASNRATLISKRNGSFEMNYVYNGTTGYTMTMTEGGAVTLWQKLMANGMGLVDSTIQSDMPGDSITEKYFYNAASQVIEMRGYDYNSGVSTLSDITRFEYDGNGNRTKEIELTPMGDTVSVMTTTYSSAVPNWYTSGVQFMPVVQKNLPVSVTYYDPSTGDTQTSTITYEMDTRNRITKETYTITGFGTYSKSYIYF
ncbi:MAG: hypothetical protein EOO10_26115 [Chitinophagaceae bacterium]|nr:MAG: hypothetical protein EOO10_26115 [Chitinophagaceae bacterium]